MIFTSFIFKNIKIEKYFYNALYTLLKIKSIDYNYIFNIFVPIKRFDKTINNIERGNEISFINKNKILFTFLIESCVIDFTINLVSYILFSIQMCIIVFGLICIVNK